VSKEFFKAYFVGEGNSPGVEEIHYTDLMKRN
jgi:hypothetical protein